MNLNLALPWHKQIRITRKRREHLAFLTLILPNTILLAVWTFWPFFYSIYLSLTNWNLLRPDWDMVGLQNYIALFKSAEFWQISKNTVIFAGGVVVIGLAISLSLAVLLNQQLIGRGLWRLIIFSPHITTTAAMALVWSSMYTPKYGIFSNFFSFLGLEFPNVLADNKLALPALMLVAIWKSLGFSTVVFLAALQGVDNSLKEAAAIDGANPWQIFWNVTFPAITPVTYFLVITGIISAFRSFDIVAVMTRGGPSNASNLLVYQIYREAFSFQRFGYASALAVILFLVLMVITYLQTRANKLWVNY
ncbi:MAG: sugar ABC transporter permease [Anaerolineales bacterium]|nr:sugar ABC transporter permease [Anaerolineales bacterium]